MRTRVFTRLFSLMILLSRILVAQSSLELTGFGFTTNYIDASGGGIAGIHSLPEGPGEYSTALAASWHNIRATQLYVSLGLDQLNGEKLGTYVDISPQLYQVLFHLDNQTAFGVGIKPVSRVAALIRDYSSSLVFQGDTVRYAHYQSVRGGLSAFSVGYSRQVNSRVSGGIELNYLFGTIQQRDTLDIIDRGRFTDLPTAGAYVLGNRISQRLEFNGLEMALSGIMSRFLSEKGNLGVQFSFPLALDLLTTQVIPVLGRSTVSRQTNLGYPWKLAVGYGVDLNPVQRVSVEGELSKMDSDTRWTSLFDQVVDDRIALRVGWTKLPDPDPETWRDALYLRMGFYLTQYYLSALRESPLREVGGGVGFGFKYNRGRARVNLNVQIGRRDSLFPDFGSENFLKLSLGLSTGEKWFNRKNKIWD